MNSCRRATGTTKTSKGEAKVEDKATNAKLKVAFFKPFYGKYWIIDLAADYSYAVVGERSREISLDSEPYTTNERGNL